MLNLKSAVNLRASLQQAVADASFSRPTAEFRVKWKMVVLPVLLLVSACACVEEGEIEIKPEYQLETLLSAELGEGVLDMEVVSTGCTRAEDFTIHYEAQGDYCVASVYRIRPDRCRRSPFPQSLQLEISPPESCESLPVRITNSLMQSDPEGLDR